jgi:hypothetical protein
MTQVEPTALGEAWAALGGDAEALSRVTVRGSVGLPCVLPVETLAWGAVAAQRLAAEQLRAGTGPVPVVTLDAAHVGFAFRSERHVRLDGVPAGPGFAPLSRFLRTTDGWVRLHANYPHHCSAVHRALGPEPARAIAERSGQEVEDSVVAAGGVAAAVRSEQQWRAHPQGTAVAGLPLLSLRKVGSAAPRQPSLRGLRVLDLTRVIAGPVATRTLASYGADVLRIDDPGLPEDPATLLDTCPGKRLAALDLRRPDDLARFEELLARADVLVQGYRPGALAAHGLGTDALAERRPGLVVVTLSAWGTAGPWASRRGFDSIVQAASGIADVLRRPDGTPGALPAQALDHAAGHLVAATVLSALHRQRREGGTWHGSVSLARLADWLLTAPRRPVPEDDAAVDDRDPSRYLVELPSPFGAVTLVRPPGSPAWRRGPVPSGYDRAEW